MSAADPFTHVVKDVGFVLAAGAAISLAWRRRSKWEPDLQELPDAPAKVAAAVSAVLLGLLWFDEGRSLGLPPLQMTAIIAIGAAVGALLLYVVLNASLLVEQQVAKTTKTVTTRKIIGGLWLTQQAAQEHKKGTDVAKILLMGGSDPHSVWPRVARGISQAIFVATYMVLVIGGSTALAAVGLLIQSQITPPSERIVGEPTTAIGMLPTRR